MSVAGALLLALICSEAIGIARLAWKVRRLRRDIDDYERICRTIVDGRFD